MEQEIAKGLEVWALQTLLDLSILLGFLALGLVLVDGYLRRVGRLLTLRVSKEVWQVFPVVMVDLSLAGVALVGLLIINPDVMADIKVAVPFYPLATVLLTAALVLRVFGGGHEAGSAAHRRASWLLAAGSLLNLLGFTFVMEAPGPEYLALHPSPMWAWIKATLRSNVTPDGVELAYWSFWIFFPLLVGLLGWAVFKALPRGSARGPEASPQANAASPGAKRAGQGAKAQR